MTPGLNPGRVSPSRKTVPAPPTPLPVSAPKKTAVEPVATLMTPE